jgi:hypothetical protein
VIRSVTWHVTGAYPPGADRLDRDADKGELERSVQRVVPRTPDPCIGERHDGRRSAKALLFFSKLIGRGVVGLQLGQASRDLLPALHVALGGAAKVSSTEKTRDLSGDLHGGGLGVSCAIGVLRGPFRDSLIDVPREVNFARKCALNACRTRNNGDSRCHRCMGGVGDCLQAVEQTVGVACALRDPGTVDRRSIERNRGASRWPGRSWGAAATRREHPHFHGERISA